jgi:hypothetical protein
MGLRATSLSHPEYFILQPSFKSGLDSPLKTPIGSFVRVSPNDDVAQVVDQNVGNRKILVKLLPRIDYAELSRTGLKSQRKLNLSMAATYVAPRTLFNCPKD